MRWAGHVKRVGEMTNAHTILVGKPEGKRPFRGKPKWEDNIKINHKNGIENMELIQMTQNTVQWRDLGTY
jgi:hypothetical protein